MDRSIIEKTIDYLLQIKGVTVVKCKPSYRPHVLEVLKGYAEKYGYTIQTYKDKSIYNKDAIATLYDSEHDTMIEFNKDFINANNIDWNNTGKKKINIDDIFNAYEQLPNKCKNSIGLLKHTTEDSFGILGDKALGWSSIYESKDNTFNVVNIPSSFLEDYTGEGQNYDFILAHESIHCNDYHKFTPSEMETYTDIKNRYANNTSREPIILTDEEKEVYNKVSNLVNNDYTHMSMSVMGEDNGGFQEAIQKNGTYLNNGVKPQLGEWGKLTDNKASDYGAMDIREDYAEYGAMVITGYNNPTNSESRVKFDNEWMQYQEWSRLHPYQIQYFVKDLYDEDVSIEQILEDSVVTSKNNGEYKII